MYNYDNEYTQPNFESDYEFNDQESDFENEDYEYDMEADYESENDYEDEFKFPIGSAIKAVTNPLRSPGLGVLGSLLGGPRSSTTSPGSIPRPGYPRPWGSVYPPRPGYPRPWGSVYPPRPGYPRPWGSVYPPRPGYPRPWGLGYPRPWSSTYPRPWGTGYRPPYYNRYPRPLYGTGIPGSTAMPGQSYTPSEGATSYAPSAGTSFADQPAQSAPPSNDNSIMESIRNLSQQIASTNSTVASLQRTIAESANAQPPAPGGDPTAGNAGPAMGQPPSSEYEMGDYEYDMENEAMRYGDGSNELNEMELAAELLNVNNEMELDHFLGGLFKKLTSVLGGGAGGSGGLGSLFKMVAPIAASAFLGPVGGIAAKALTGEVFGLEMEGMSHEDQEFETARAFIRLATDAANELAQNPGTSDPAADAKNALIQSASQNAPGLLVQKRRKRGDGRRGRWHRRGNKIVIENAF